MATTAPPPVSVPILVCAARSSLAVPLVLAPVLCIVAGLITSDTAAANWSVVACSLCAASAIVGTVSLLGIPKHGWKRILPLAVPAILLNLGLGYLCLVLGAQNDLAR